MKYDRFHDQLKSAGDENACAPIAVAIASGESFEDVMAAFELAGRKPKGTSHWGVILKAIDILGYKLAKNSIESKSVRTAERELRRYYPNEPLILDLPSHWAAWDGEIIDDWTRGSCKRVSGEIFKLIKKA